jgi:cytochrome b6-f complex iron-sulfur subunit
MISRDDHHEDGAGEARPSPPGDAAIGRRTFLKQMEVLAGSAMCGALPLLGGCAARARYLTPTVQGDRLAVRLADAIAASGLLVEDPRSDLPIFLRRTPEGEYTAVSTKCGHRGCQVEPAADRMACPCHGSEYTFEGAILQGPTQRPLTRFRVTSDVEHVYIHIGTSKAP